MPVVSISLNDTLLEKIESIEKEMGFSGRSEVIRTALRKFIEEKEELEDIEGEISCVMVVRHEEGAELGTHDYQHLIDSQLHSHNQRGECFQTFVLEGKASEILKLKKNLESDRKVEKVEIIKS